MFAPSRHRRARERRSGSTLPTLGRLTRTFWSAATTGQPCQVRASAPDDQVTDRSAFANCSASGSHRVSAPAVCPAQTAEHPGSPGLG